MALFTQKMDFYPPGGDRKAPPNSLKIFTRYFLTHVPLLIDSHLKYWKKSKKRPALLGSHGGTSRRYNNNDVILCPKTMAKYFDFLVVPPFQHCHKTQHCILYKPNGLLCWHKPRLWKQWRHILTKTKTKQFSSLFSLCHCFNTVIWLSIALSTNAVGCHGSTSRRYGNN